jgi:hypothetical protein
MLMNNMLETDITLIHDDHKQKEDEEQRRDKNLKTSNTNKSLFIDICQSSTIFLFLIIIAIIPSMFIGLRNDSITHRTLKAIR